METTNNIPANTVPTTSATPAAPTKGTFTIQDALRDIRKYREENSKDSDYDKYTEKTLTIEQIKLIGECDILDIMPADDKSKAFFVCGLVGGAVSKGVQDAVFIEGKMPRMKVRLVNKPVADEWGPEFKGFQLILDTRKAGTVSI